jgi:hypothetical protein
MAPIVPHPLGTILADAMLGHADHGSRHRARCQILLGAQVSGDIGLLLQVCANLVAQTRVKSEFQATFGRFAVRFAVRFVRLVYL